MAITRICDYCGEEISKDDPFVTFSVDGEHSDERWSSGWLGHYHTNERTGLDRLRRQGDGRSTAVAEDARDCWEQVDDALRLIHGVSQGLELLPVSDEVDRSPTQVVQVDEESLDLPYGEEYFRRAQAGTPLTDIVASRARQALRRADLVTLEEASGRLEAEIAAIDGVGPGSIKSLRAALSERGLSFAIDSIEPTELASRVREIRRMAGVSRPRFACDLGVSASLVGKWERDGTVARNDRKRLVERFGLEADFLGSLS